VDGTHRTRITNTLAGDPYEDSPSFANPEWSPVSNKIAFMWDWGGYVEVHVMSQSGLMDKTYLGPNTRVSPEGVSGSVPDWSPDGTQIAFLYWEDPCPYGGSYSLEIYKVSADGSGTLMSLTNDPASDYYPAFSPGGGKIVFSSNRDGDFDLYIMNADGTGDPQQLTDTQAKDTLPD
jgi:Tol biopolymer transport system component